jgi:microcompartment protein CcmL/EutN
MTKRHRLPALVIAGVLAVVTAAVATAGSSDAFRSASRTTVAPAPKPRVQKPHASAMAQVRTLQKQLAKAKASLKAQQRQLASAKTPAKKAALKKSIAKAQAKVKSLDKALANAKSRACDKGYRLSGSSCVATG